jgi:thymidylate kinase
MPRLPFITFEGSEGCGKSTQVQRLAMRLKKLQIPFLITREPGGTPIGETIRELLQFASHNSSMRPETELLLYYFRPRCRRRDGEIANAGEAAQSGSNGTRAC